MVKMFHYMKERWHYIVLIIVLRVVDMKDLKQQLMKN